MLSWRLSLGAGLIAGLFALCWLDASAARPGTYLAPVAILAAWLSAGELLRMFRARGMAPSAATVYAAALLPVAAACLPIVWPGGAAVCPVSGLDGVALALVASAAIAMGVEMRRFDGPGRAIGEAAMVTLAAVYVGGAVAVLVELRLLGSRGGMNAGWPQLVPLLSLIVTVKLSDICQYFIGRTWGKRKLAPTISPGKTWEGAVGGIATASIISALILAWLTRGAAGMHAANLLRLACFALLIAVAGLFGDLCESLLKRDAVVKDSSDWLPGFGGVLDLLDSLLLAGPVAYALWAWTPLCP